MGVREVIKRRTTYEVLGRPLHEPLANEPSITRKVRAINGLPKEITAQRDIIVDPKHMKNVASTLDPLRPQAHDIAQRIALEIGDIRDAVRMRRNRFLDEGRLDRSRLVGAYKGDQTIYYQESPADDDTSLCASLLLDVSGSMEGEARSGQLYMATSALSEAMTSLQMPHEVRAFSDYSYEIKAINDPTLEDRRAAMLLKDKSGTAMSETAALARTSLLGRAERNKLVLCLSDGDLNSSDHSPACAETKALREAGALTFGVFLARKNLLGDDQKSKLDEIYGKGSWVEIQTIDQFPQKVARRIADIFREMD